MMEVWVYQGKELKVSRPQKRRRTGLMRTTPEGVAFKCEVEGDEEFETLQSNAPGC